MTMLTLTRRAFGLAALGSMSLAGLKAGAQGAAAPTVAVFKDPNCGCCRAWADHVRSAGFPVEIVETANLDAVKARLKVPASLAACHSATIGGYVIEGHVPATAIQRLLREKPDAIGLAVRGMPVGSPGMELAGSAPDTYDVVLFGPGGQARFARFEGGREV